MPLLKRKPFSLLEPPNDLEPHEFVFQVRFTKEIFQDYQEYLKRINLYRQRVWTCKVIGKINMTYEEALVSEKRAAKKAQKFPVEFIETVLRTVQYSVLPLGDLIHKIRTNLQENLVEGVELHGKKAGYVYPCKIVKVLDKGANNAQYEVEWKNVDGRTDEITVIDEKDLIPKKLPFGREVLKSFIRESTCQSLPWVIHNNLASKYGIPVDPPEDIKCKISFLNGFVICNKKRKRNEEFREGNGAKDKQSIVDMEKSDVPGGNETIKYPIDDQLVRPGADDPVFMDRPSPLRDFSVPLDCIGNLLMVWDFCSSFGRLLNLWPFSLEDFEKAICHKESNLALIVETHTALLHLLIKEEGQYYMALEIKKRKPKITLTSWMEYLCDFIEMVGTYDLTTHMPTIKRGHYGLLDPPIKLRILKELVDLVVATDLVREKLDEYLEQRRALSASKRGELLEVAKKKREAKKHLRVVSEVIEHNSDIVDDGSHVPGKNVHSMVNGNYVEKISSNQNHPLLNGGNGNQTIGVQDKTKRLPEELERSKEQRKEFLEREMEKRVIRTNPLGKDRDYNRYWFFRRDGRIFVEGPDSKKWGYYNSKEELDVLIGSLNPKGERERALKKQLEKYYPRICKELFKRSKEATVRLAMGEVVRRSTRVRAPPRDNPTLAYLKYFNKWKAF